MKFILLTILVLFILINCPIKAVPIDTEYGDKFQGDIILTQEQKEIFSDTGGKRKTGIVFTSFRWPKVNGRVKVPYIIDSIFTIDEKNIITNAMADIRSKTCIDFIQRTSEIDYIRIISDDGCWSYVGKIGGMQDLSLKKSGCMIHGRVLHELIHALGFEHMHQHWDRDYKVQINYENIQDGMLEWFIKLNQNQLNNYETPYDISSVMHYGPTSFSKNGKNTIQAYSNNDQLVMGQRSYLSQGDITRLNNMYQC